MSHKQFEKWILDDSPLSEEKRKDLVAHLKTCEECRQLKNGRENSLQWMHSAQNIQPAAGFTARWQTKLQQEQRRKSIIRRRVILMSSIFVLLSALFAYVLLSGSLNQFLANTITFSTQALLFMTKGISNITSFIAEIPALLRWSLGLFLVGIANMFVILLAVILWQARQNHKAWQGAEGYAEK
jgi:predicted anti-sigma-YlaC factor YlaD